MYFGFVNLLDGKNKCPNLIDLPRFPRSVVPARSHNYMASRMKQGEQGDGLCRRGCEQQPINQPAFNRAAKAQGQRG